MFTYSIPRARGPKSWSRIEGAADRLSAAYGQRRYKTLFYSVIATLSCAPLIRLFHLRMHLLEVFLGFNLLAAIIPIARPAERRIMFAVIFVAGLLRTSMVSEYVSGMDTVNLSTQIGIAMLAAVAALRFAMSVSTISSEHIYAALSAYVLAGVFGGAFYSAMSTLGRAPLPSRISLRTDNFHFRRQHISAS